MTDKIQIQVLFTITRDSYTYTDALYFPVGEPLPSEEDIESMKQQRFDNWYAIVTAPPPEQEGTPEEEAE